MMANPNVRPAKRGPVLTLVTVITLPAVEGEVKRIDRFESSFPVEQVIPIIEETGARISCAGNGDIEWVDSFNVVAPTVVTIVSVLCRQNCDGSKVIADINAVDISPIVWSDNND